MRTIIKTKDGSDTVFDATIGECFHSIHGALTESRHVFIQQGLHVISQRTRFLKVFEMGFGTGLNAFLTYLETLQVTDLEIEYTALDAFPLERELVCKLNYPDLLCESLPSNAFFDFHQIEWESFQALSDRFALKKHQATLESYVPDDTYHLLYFDAFSPSHQADLWCPELLAKIASMMNPGSLLVSYCARAQFKRNLRALGFEIERVPGPPGKREMTRAWYKP